MTVTRTEPVARNRSRRVIVVDDDIQLEVSDDTYVRFALFVGRQVDRALLDEVRHTEERHRSRRTAMAFLGPRMRSRHEVEKRLAEGGISRAIIDETLEFLERYGMIDDVAFAAAYVNDRLLKKAVGRRTLEAELRRKGIDADTASQAVERVDEGRELDLALAAARTKLRSLKGDDRQRNERALASRLAARGFSWEVIRVVIDRYRDDPDLNRTDE